MIMFGYSKFIAWEVHRLTEIQEQQFQVQIDGIYRLEYSDDGVISILEMKEIYWLILFDLDKKYFKCKTFCVKISN